MKKIILATVVLIITNSVPAQTIQGDALISFAGTKADAPATKKFFDAYEIKGTAGGKYSSYKYGIDISTRNDTLTDISLYRTNSLYGSYTNKLPKGITFGMSSADVVKVLGKPTLSYINSGYCEYHFGKVIMTYWFEEGALNQVSILYK